jgi:Homing endonuclease associated repeat
MYSKTPTVKPTKDEIIAAIQVCAAKLGHVPREEELKRESGIGGKIFRRHFGNYTKALKASGFDGTGAGYKVSMEDLFKEWAGMARALGATPSIAEYMQRSQYSVSPLRQRFGGWNNVPGAMARYAEENGLAEEWADILELAKKHRPRGNNGEWRSKFAEGKSTRPQILNDRPVYGAALIPPAMCFAPVNEMGVVYLFGALSSKLGFVVTWVGTQYPDIEAFREVTPGRWQRARVEVEYQSRNFLQHFHDPKECDLIVCWENNWPDAPMEVISLKEHMGLIAKVTKD